MRISGFPVIRVDVIFYIAFIHGVVMFLATPPNPFILSNEYLVLILINEYSFSCPAMLAMGFYTLVY